MSSQRCSADPNLPVLARQSLQRGPWKGFAVLEPRWSIPRKLTRIFTSGLSLPQQSHAAMNLSSPPPEQRRPKPNTEQIILAAQLHRAKPWRLSGVSSEVLSELNPQFRQASRASS